MTTDRKTVWGIDLGTTYSCIARVDQYGRAVVENNRDGDPTTASVVMFVTPEEIQVGKEAKAQAQMDPDLVCELVKRQMSDSKWRFGAHGREWSASEVSAHILGAIAADAELQTGEKVEKVVITVPAYFGIAERKATIAAGEMAGLEVADVLNEPTAAAFSYGFGQGADVEETVLVYDLGGGTFDVTIIRLEPTADGGSHIRVIATGGDARLGGANWDGELATLLASKFQEAHADAPDPLDDKATAAALRLKAEEVKRSLTLRESVTQIVMGGSEKENVQVTREEFEAATADLLERTVEFTRQTLGDAAKKGYGEIDRVLLVGGSSFMPAVKRTLSQNFGWTPELEDPNQAVAKGAALFGLQVELQEMIEGATTDPESGEPVDVAEVERSVAEEVGVELGTLRQLTKTQITNVCSRGFGVKVVREGRTGDAGDEDFYVDHLINPNDPLPVDPPQTRTYGTVKDRQSSVEVVLMEQAGTITSELMNDNSELEKASFQLSGNDPAGAPIHVSMGMENNGTLTIFARDDDGHELTFSAAAEGAVLSQEQIEASTERVQGMRRT